MEELRNAFLLREAAGSFWLLDMRQSGKEFRKPAELNESAAQIWEWYASGKEAAEIAKKLSKKYGIPEKEALEDVLQFLDAVQRA